eukprot:833547-Pelagomonas_calceolata.AAC.1
MSTNGVPHARGPHLPISILLEARSSIAAAISVTAENSASAANSVTAASKRLHTAAASTPPVPTPTQQPPASEARASLGGLNCPPLVSESNPTSPSNRPSSPQTPAGWRQAAAGVQETNQQKCLTARLQQDATALHLTWLPALGLAAAALRELQAQLSTHSARSAGVHVRQLVDAYCHGALLVCDLEAAEQAGVVFEAEAGEANAEGLPVDGPLSSSSADLSADLQQQEQRQSLRGNRVPAHGAAAEHTRQRGLQDGDSADAQPGAQFTEQSYLQESDSAGAPAAAGVGTQGWRQQQGSSSRLVQGLRGQDWLCKV